MISPVALLMNVSFDVTPCILLQFLALRFIIFIAHGYKLSIIAACTGTTNTLIECTKEIETFTKMTRTIVTR